MAPPRTKGAVTTSEDKKSKNEDESLMYSAESMQHNVQAVYCCRTFLAIIGGCVTGIMGFTGILGFFCYFLTMGIASAGLFVKAKFNVGKYFDSWNRLALDGVMGGLMSFILFWALTYDTVHIF
eukprot:TRINITY_DN7142_c0_g1_i1.p2 TRINITY_DN7142_c0_g1~~TRINITY_DN7142_c0_g1_i1.p2  ORF type:complete len:124 (+),score=10.62 TRINITY_DN7142_c0_g1_i1:54-425(+)